MSIIFIFIDGLGLGDKNPESNPIYAAGAKTLIKLLEDPATIPTDTSMGVKGLPQSATGQTAIFTGVNAAAVLGRHMNGQPTITLKNIINENNLFMELMNRGLKVTNANIYRQEYLDKMMDPKERRYRPSVTSVMTLSAGIRFRDVEDYKLGMGVYHDITGKIVNEYYATEVITPGEAAQRIYDISRNYDFTLFEHFMTDIIGHTMDMEKAKDEIRMLDTFISKLYELYDPQKDIIIITSDHGNIEDITVKTHTMNKIPTIISGNVPAGFKPSIDSLPDIMPAVLCLAKEKQ